MHHKCPDVPETNLISRLVGDLVVHTQRQFEYTRVSLSWTWLINTGHTQLVKLTIRPRNLQSPMNINSWYKLTGAINVYTCDTHEHPINRLKFLLKMWAANLQKHVITKLPLTYYAAFPKIYLFDVLQWLAIAQFMSKFCYSSIAMTARSGVKVDQGILGLISFFLSNCKSC